MRVSAAGAYGLRRTPPPLASPLPGLLGSSSSAPADLGAFFLAPPPPARTAFWVELQHHTHHSSSSSLYGGAVGQLQHLTLPTVKQCAAAGCCACMRLPRPHPHAAAFHDLLERGNEGRCARTHSDKLNGPAIYGRGLLVGPPARGMPGMGARMRARVRTRCPWSHDSWHEHAPLPRQPTDSGRARTRGTACCLRWRPQRPANSRQQATRTPAGSTERAPWTLHRHPASSTAGRTATLTRCSHSTQVVPVPRS